MEQPVEKWKNVVGYKGSYQVSNLGRVRSLDRKVRRGKYYSYREGKLLKPRHKGKLGHLIINLYAKGKRKTKYIHRIVLEAFMGRCPKGKESCHGPKGNLDNTLSNLSWCTRSKNSGEDRYRDGTMWQAKRVQRSDGREFRSEILAAKHSKCSQSNICQTCRGRRNTAGGFGWKYI